MPQLYSWSLLILWFLSSTIALCDTQCFSRWSFHICIMLCWKQESQYATKFKRLDNKLYLYKLKLSVFFHGHCLQSSREVWFVEEACLLEFLTYCPVNHEWKSRSFLFYIFKHQIKVITQLLNCYIICTKLRSLLLSTSNVLQMKSQSHGVADDTAYAVNSSLWHIVVRKAWFYGI